MQHLASDVSFSNDYEGTIKATKQMTNTFLTAANNEASVRSVVLTSSRIASYQPEAGKDIHATNKDWTDFFFDLAEKAKDDDPNKPVFICEHK